MNTVDEIFQNPNTEENGMQKLMVTYMYKEENDIPQNHGVNVCNVVEWAKENYDELTVLVDEMMSEIKTVKE